jgi:hypothetical protein
MGPTAPLRRPSPAVSPPLPVARLHGAEADFDRAQRSVVGALAVAVLWFLPIAALALTIALTT